jgi:hypothetical protein
MAYAYYGRLTPTQQRIYRRSDAVTSVPVPGTALLRPLVEQLAAALASGERLRTQAATRGLLASLSDHLGVSPLRAEVLATRPSRRWGELHGLYTPPRNGRPARVTLWMQTARRQRVVAFRTFLRTLLHELCHHLDYERLGLADSFHTEGFYKRESSLFHQLMGSPGPPEVAENA